jgi:hypothetical protein
VTGQPLVEAMDDAGVLDPPVPVEEARPDGPDAREPRPADHLAEPSRVDHLGVVIEEQDQILIDQGHGRIVDRGEAEPAVAVGDPQHAMG